MKAVGMEVRCMELAKVTGTTKTINSSRLIKANTWMGSSMDKASIAGQMVVYLKANGKMVR